MVAIIDTREQMPYAFPCATVRATLTSGDYSLQGYETRVAVERKRPVELFTCFTTERDRFRREFERLAAYDYAAVVIEGDLTSCAVLPSRYSRVSPSTVINSLISWSIRYGVAIWFAQNRELAQTLTFRILQKFFCQTLEYPSILSTNNAQFE
jgi:DNA excision repair protein ERCC-4